MITSPDNQKLKAIRKLRARRERDRTGLFAAEGEDLVAAARAVGTEPEFVLVAGRDVEPALLDAVSALGSGTRVIGVYRQRWSEPHGRLSAYLHGVGDPGNVGTVIRAGHAFADGPVVLGPGCADPYSPKAVRASMGSVFARPPARATFAELRGRTVALDPRAPLTLREALADADPSTPLTVCVGAERDGLPADVLEAADASARITVRPDGPESLNVAIAAAVALHELNRIAANA